MKARNRRPSVTSDADDAVFLRRVDPRVIGAKSGGPDHRPRRHIAAIGEAHRVASGVHRAWREAQSVGGSGPIEIRLEVAARSQWPREPGDESGTFVEDAVAQERELPPGRRPEALRGQGLARSDRDGGRTLARHLDGDLPAGVRRADHDDRTPGKVARPPVVAAMELQHGGIEPRSEVGDARGLEVAPAITTERAWITSAPTVASSAPAVPRSALTAVPTRRGKRIS